MTRLAILQVRNESFYLPTFLDHIRDYVDGFVALDDGSTDDTAAILGREPKMLDVLSNPRRDDEIGWDEPGNRRRLMERAHAIGAHWALCLDPDERLEARFLGKIDRVQASRERAGKTILSFILRELWDSIDTYRVDGVWGVKTAQTRFFRMPEVLSFDHLTALHGQWQPYPFDPAKHEVLGYSLYHLKMIRRADRVARAMRYERLDPDRLHQSMGYAYLADESGAQLEPINDVERYETRFVPHGLPGCR